MTNYTEQTPKELSDKLLLALQDGLIADGCDDILAILTVNKLKEGYDYIFQQIDLKAKEVLDEKEKEIENKNRIIAGITNENESLRSECMRDKNKADEFWKEIEKLRSDQLTVHTNNLKGVNASIDGLVKQNEIIKDLESKISELNAENERYMEGEIHWDAEVKKLEEDLRKEKLKFDAVTSIDWGLIFAEILLKTTTGKFPELPFETSHKVFEGYKQAVNDYILKIQKASNEKTEAIKNKCKYRIGNECELVSFSCIYPNCEK